MVVRSWYKTFSTCVLDPDNLTQDFFEILTGEKITYWLRENSYSGGLIGIIVEVQDFPTKN